jgi:hypothetical protein
VHVVVFIFEETTRPGTASFEMAFAYTVIDALDPMVGKLAFEEKVGTLFEGKEHEARSCKIETVYDEHGLGEIAFFYDGVNGALVLEVAFDTEDSLGFFNDDEGAILVDNRDARFVAFFLPNEADLLTGLEHFVLPRYYFTVNSNALFSQPGKPGRAAALFGKVRERIRKRHSLFDDISHGWNLWKNGLKKRKASLMVQK